jgi:hypothetical protein
MFEIPISKNYAPNWTLTHALRELYSNALDAQARNPEHKASVYQEGQTLVFRNEKVRLDPKYLVLGESGEKGVNVIGQFGEGLVLSMLVLARLGASLDMVNDDEKWEVTLAFSERFNTEVLHVRTRKIKARGYLEIRVSPCAPGLQDELDKLYLSSIFTTMRVKSLPNRDDRLKSKVLIPSIMATEDEWGIWSNAVFCRGSLITKFVSGLTYRGAPLAFDLPNLEINRDRSSVSSYSVADGIISALKNLEDQAFNTIFGEVDWDGIHTDLACVFRYDDTIRRRLEESIAAYQQRHAGKVLVESENAVDRLAAVGIAARVAPKVIASMMSVNVEELVAEAGMRSMTYLSSDDLLEPEREVLREAVKLCRDAGVFSRGRKSGEWPYRLADANAEVYGACRLKFQGSEIIINRPALSSVENAVATIIHEIGHATSRRADGDEVFHREVEDIWTALLAHMRNNS